MKINDGIMKCEEKKGYNKFVRKTKYYWAEGRIEIFLA